MEQESPTYSYSVYVPTSFPIFDGMLDLRLASRRNAALAYRDYGGAVSCQLHDGSWGLVEINKPERHRRSFWSRIGSSLRTAEIAEEILVDAEALALGRALQMADGK